MTGMKQFLNRLPVFPLFAGIALSIGLLVPSIFEWGEKPAARSRHPEMERAAFIVFAVTLVVAAICWYLSKPSNFERPIDSKENSRRFQFGVRGLLIATTLAAASLAVAPWMNLIVSTAIVLVTAFAVLVYSFYHSWPVRSRTGALLASMFLPFAWMIRYNRPFGHTSGLIAALPIGPAIVPATLTGGHLDHSSWIAATIIVIELVVGAWLMRRGGKLAFVYLIFLLLFSSFNSLVLHLLYRV